MMQHILASRAFRYSAAAAAVVIAAVVVHFATTIPGGSRPAWAAEQTDAALANVSTLRMIGTIEPTGDDAYTGLPPVQGTQTFQVWARKSPTRNKSGDVRLESSSGRVLAVTGGESRLYDPQSNTLVIADWPFMTISPWLDSAFKALEAMADEWTVSYGQDERTGRDSVFVETSFGQRSWWFQFDAETKLPVRFRQWDINPRREGPATFAADEIVYGVAMHDAMLELDVPDDATIRHLQGTAPPAHPTNANNGEITLEKLDRLSGDPDAGMLVGDLTDTEAAEEITRRLFEACIRDDQADAAKLWPVVALMGEDNWYESTGGDNPPVEIVRIGPAADDPACDIGLVVPYTLRKQDGSGRARNLVVRFRQIDGVRSCVIVGPYGDVQDTPPDQMEQRYPQ